MADKGPIQTTAEAIAEIRRSHKDSSGRGFPSTAFIDSKGKYQHCKTNQPLAEAQAQGLTGARPIAPHKHPVSHAGYCEAHKVSAPVKNGAIVAGSSRSQWSTRESPRSTETQ